MNDNASEEMLIGELARRTGVSTATINFYVQNGLLPRPRKVNRTRAYYDQRHIIRLAIIKRLQVRHGLPLAVIRSLLERTRNDEQLLARLAALRGPVFAADLLRLPAVDDGMRMSRAEFLRESGLTEEQLGDLERRDLLRASGPEGLFTAPDLAAGRALGRLLELGAGEQLVRLYGEFLAVQRRMADYLYLVLLPDHRREWLSQQLTGANVSELSGTVEAYLRYRAAAETLGEALQRLFPEVYSCEDKALPGPASSDGHSAETAAKAARRPRSGQAVSRR